MYLFSSPCKSSFLHNPMKSDKLNLPTSSGISSSNVRTSSSPSALEHLFLMAIINITLLVILESSAPTPTVSPAFDLSNRSCRNLRNYWTLMGSIISILRPPRSSDMQSFLMNYQ
ncbi:hypothetical protein MRB53_012336 [Persea americana]|uniref:Uncharacterized protein n=1 Tax=Persea americana TaxID=3435 RepID=A0ACC2LYG3_PERAE|nr:hypothetical protein MRB53_012336 [Persea americana]